MGWCPERGAPGMGREAGGDIEWIVGGGKRKRRARP